jgi:carbonic anhydrase
MDKILNGIVEFRQNDFEEHRALFKSIGSQQNPHTLFIGCSDSRVVPNLITKTQPGEIFMVRNVGNLVPPYRDSQEYLATTAAIEYAVQVLHVESIVVCGHSNCGGCAALYMDSEIMSHIPHTRKWLELALPVKEKVLSVIREDDLIAREWLTEQVNVVEQLKHLLSYPFISEQYASGKLKINGWHYIIETGEIFNYNKEKGYFELIN